jgi:hypothetical protein
MQITNSSPESIKLTLQDNTFQTVDFVTQIEYLAQPLGQVAPYSQRDNRWKDDLMITSTIGQVGCAMVCCAMLGSQYYTSLTPKTLNDYLRNNSGYTNGNLIYWAKVSGLIPELQFRDYKKWQNVEADLPYVISELEKHPVILQVDFRPGGALDTHFVLALSYADNDIDIIDPWDGVQTKLLRRYALADWNLKRAIYAMVVYD